MSQHDMDIANQTAPSARADINLALKALASCSSGASGPSPSLANQLWYDTTFHQLRVRDETNSFWTILGTVNQSTGAFEPNFTPATNGDALTGTNNTKIMTPLRVKESANNAINVYALGIAQSWQNVTGARATNTYYTNGTGKPIAVVIEGVSGTSGQFQVSADGVNWVTIGSVVTNGFDIRVVNAIVPPGHSYVLLTATAAAWLELR
jgi:hypothetical protein